MSILQDLQVLEIVPKQQTLRRSISRHQGDLPNTTDHLITLTRMFGSLKRIRCRWHEEEPLKFYSGSRFGANQYLSRKPFGSFITAILVLSHVLWKSYRNACREFVGETASRLHIIKLCET